MHADKASYFSGTVSFVQFVKRPVVLILYTNDFAQHRRCVLELATYLQNRANCDVELDEWALTSTANGYRTPAEWLMHALQRADYYLIVFSAGGKETVFRPMDTSSFVELRSERPWDETFAPAMNFVLQRILHTARSVDSSIISRDNLASGKNRSAAAFDRYVCLYFSYSSPTTVPDLFRTLPCPKFQLPDELRRLICHVHELQHDTVYEDCPMEADRLTSSITEASRFVESNPEWLQSRLVERGVGERTSPELNERQRISEISAAIDRLRAPAARRMPENLDELYVGLLEEQNREQEGREGIGIDEDVYPLVPPTSGNQQEEPIANGNFELLPPDDDELASMFYSNTTTDRSHGPA